jgi:hypothetical protein
MLHVHEGEYMNKRYFDLVVAIVVGCGAAFTLPRLWATKKLMTDSSGLGYDTAAVVKVVTA